MLDEKPSIRSSRPDAIKAALASACTLSTLSLQIACVAGSILIASPAKELRSSSCCREWHRREPHPDNSAILPGLERYRAQRTLLSRRGAVRCDTWLPPEPR